MTWTRRRTPARRRPRWSPTSWRTRPTPASRRRDLEEQQTSLRDANGLAVLIATSNEFEVRDDVDLHRARHLQGPPACPPARSSGPAHRRTPAAARPAASGSHGGQRGRAGPARHVRCGVRQLRERARVPAAAPRVDRQAALPLSRVRHHDPRAGQHPDRVVAAAARDAVATATSSIPLRYPLVEAVTAGLFVLLGVKFGREAALWPALALAVDPGRGGRHRPRAADHPEPADGGRRSARARAVDDRRSEPPAREPDRRRGRGRPAAGRGDRLSRRAWAWAT